jgi:hypothetical protein
MVDTLTPAAGQQDSAAGRLRWANFDFVRRREFVA